MYVEYWFYTNNHYAFSKDNCRILFENMQYKVGNRKEFKGSFVEVYTMSAIERGWHYVRKIFSEALILYKGGLFERIDKGWSLN